MGNLVREGEESCLFGASELELPFGEDLGEADGHVFELERVVKVAAVQDYMIPRGEGNQEFGAIGAPGKASVSVIKVWFGTSDLAGGFVEGKGRVI